MPTIEISKRDLEKLSGKKFTKEMLDDALLIVKGEIEDIDDDKVKIELDDTNRVDTWSVEGIARQLNGKRGIPKFQAKKSKFKITVDKNLKGIRDYTAAFVVKNIHITEEMLIQLIQTQEKIGENFGKKRAKVGLGIYDSKKINFPIKYKGADPQKTEFIPLEFHNPLTLKEILKQHQKGIEYAHLLNGKKYYPIFIDAKNNIMSCPPIINSNESGKVTTSTKELFVEVTGTDLDSVILACNVFAQIFYDRGATIVSITVEYEFETKYGKKIATPYDFKEKISVDKDLIRKFAGLNLSDGQIRKALEIMKYDIIKVNEKSVIVKIPFYRKDILHPVDVVEDIIIHLGYNDIIPAKQDLFTLGRLSEITKFENKTRDIMIGLGFQEIWSPILTSKEKLFDKMNLGKGDIIEIKNIMSKNYSVLRNFVLSSLMDFESKNTNVEYPHYIFEVGEVCQYDLRENLGSKTLLNLSACITDSKADFTTMKAIITTLFDSLGIRFEVEPIQHPSFIKGRCAKIIVNKHSIGVFGEIHPVVLLNWGMELPCVAVELNLNSIL